MKNDTSKPGSDVVGSKEERSRISQNPYRVNKCDQILEFEGETLDDMNNFKKKSKRFFTMSMYNIVTFKEKKVETFQELLNFGALEAIPKVIQGSVSCIYFASFYRNITVCLKDKQEAENILNAYKSYRKCRMGDNLRKPLENPREKIQEILDKACMGLDVTFDESKYRNPVEIEAALNIAIDNTLKKVAENSKNFIVKPKEKKE
eukprot:CAMPEP_0170515320 /NCGR_PEP_ID=MMETSP0209-20121228/1760_1 /TAXON_ID=665100 ORGANISM="Litonotus pictus, Strain P1" /NCGR_SAMPLE_ID=MMETSP0209 /ASSEMBLY_ACC=CAM_ASM_000301 /LENGTH=204 /DNA_ID=CAMNT_0010799745 /DNA_START=203 /DNA_END=817 /DNA_ORIENTATION=-